jgi:GDP-L-fucose synthase
MKTKNIMNKDSKIYVAGHRGMVGSALVRRLKAEGYDNIITRTSKDLDLKRQADVEKFFSEEKPEYVFLAAAKVGGIVANNSYPADFMYENMMIEMNVIKSAFDNQAKKLLFLGSSCIYPRLAPQPIPESSWSLDALTIWSLIHGFTTMLVNNTIQYEGDYLDVLSLMLEKKVKI